MDGHRQAVDDALFEAGLLMLKQHAEDGGHFSAEVSTDPTKAAEVAIERVPMRPGERREVIARIPVMPRTWPTVPVFAHVAPRGRAPRPFRRRACASGASRDGPRKDDDDPLDLLGRCDCCGGWLSRRCTLCRGCPDPGVSIEQLARGRAQVDRATRAYKKRIA